MWAVYTPLKSFRPTRKSYRQIITVSIDQGPVNDFILSFFFSNYVLFCNLCLVEHSTSMEVLYQEMI
jgi:hypothetical protein